MYQLNIQSDDWPEMDLESYLAFLTQRLKLTEIDLITLVLGDTSLVQPLNKTYRGKDQSTNVLSFASDIEEELGDLIFDLAIIQEEANAQDKPFETHFKHLILHGSLHLLGYDHETEEEAAEMEALEIAILAAHGLSNPYEMIDDPRV